MTPRIRFDQYAEVANSLPHLILGFQFADGTQEWYGAPAELFGLPVAANIPFEYRPDGARRYVYCNAMNGHQRANALCEIYPVRILIIDGDAILLQIQESEAMQGTSGGHDA